jgi:hypothetical protein
MKSVIHKKNLQLLSEMGLIEKPSKLENKPHKFRCIYCDFTTCNKKDYNRHLLSAKHLNTAKILPNTDDLGPQKPQILNTFICECGKDYKHRQSLFNHKKKCSNHEKIIYEDNTLNEKEIIMTLLQQNNQLHCLFFKLNIFVDLLNERSSISIS